MTYENIRVKELKDGVVLIQLHRPKKLNSLSKKLTGELIAELQRLDSEPDKYGCAVIYGNSKVFCAGADITELKVAGGSNEAGNEQNDHVSWSTELPKIKIPMIAAVDGYCLGGGCELAMICDIIYATKRAMFGQPEINIGIIPGGGATQRMPKSIGKSNALEIILTGDQFSAKRAYEMGLVSLLFDDNEKLMSGAIKTALKISRGPRNAVISGKAAIKASFNTPLDSNGLAYERKEFSRLLGSEDKKEGMSAFLSRRNPHWTWQKKAKL